jgi:hypothetical protein
MVSFPKLSQTQLLSLLSPIYGPFPTHLILLCGERYI